jgi:hypothetical protein
MSESLFILYYYARNIIIVTINVNNQILTFECNNHLQLKHRRLYLMENMKI